MIVSRDLLRFHMPALYPEQRPAQLTSHAIRAAGSSIDAVEERTGDQKPGDLEKNQPQKLSLLDSSRLRFLIFVGSGDERGAHAMLSGAPYFL
jgi:hypothetical protein